MGFALGRVRKLDAGMVTSRFNARFPQLLRACKALIRERDPTFTYNCIQVNKNQQTAPHRDRNNKGPSYIVGLGKYTGGNVVVVGEDGGKKSFNVRHRFVKFNGQNVHYTEPFKGTRYTLVFFTVKEPSRSTKG